ncbi:MAG: extracellular solute-binding protein [Lachnospiraceae bacterium]|nr:extracellular solute-binding protein [Lachnospiraceae bacterium]
MKRGLLKYLFLPVLMAGMLVGCQGQTETGENVESVQETSSGAIDSGKNVSLTIWGAEEDVELLAEMVESFKQQYAGQADFEITIVSQGEADCKEALFADIEGGADVFAFADDQLRAMVAAGALSPVENADAIIEANIEAANEAASVNDRLYAYPMTADNGYFLYYNKEFLSDEDVKELDTILQVAADNEKKVTMDWSSGWYLYSFFGCTGLEVGLNDDGVSNYCNWNAIDTPVKGTDVAEAMLEIAANPGFSNSVDEDFIAGVQDGSVIAGVSGVWDSMPIEQAWGNNYGAVKLPTYTCAGNQIQMASFAGYKMLGVNAYSKQAEWAHKLAEWITNEENQTLRFMKRGQGPSNINASSSSEVLKSPAIQAVLKQSEFASLQRVGSTYWTPVQTFGETLADGNSQGKNLQELLDTMVEAVTESYN